MRIVNVIGILAVIAVILCYVGFLIEWSNEDASTRNHEKKTELLRRSNRLMQEKMWSDTYNREAGEPVR